MGWFSVESPPSSGEQYEGLLMAFADPLWIYWEMITLVMSTLGTWKLSGAKGMPVSLQNMFFLTGDAQARVTSAPSKRLRWMNLPEKWIFHSLIFSVISYFFTVILIDSNYLFKKSSPDFIIWIMDVLVPLRETLIDHTSALLCVHLLFIHSLLKLWENYRFENPTNRRIHLAYYIGKYLFDIAVLLTFLSEAPGFGPRQPWSEELLPSFSLSWYHILGFLAFGLITYEQKKAIKLLAVARRNHHDNAEGTRNIIPSVGGGFQFVSCPHYLYEILIYFSVLLAMGFYHAGWWLICICVAINYTFAAVLTHRQLRTIQQNYPRERKALIPYVL